MTSIRRTAAALAVAAAFSLPTFASAEEPSALCDGDKAEHKQPTADQNKQTSDRSEPKNDDKSKQKTDDSKKADSSQSGRS